MLCYRDRTYCLASADGRCSNNNCYRFLSEMDEKRAEKLDLAIAFSDFYEGCKDAIRMD